MEFLKAVSRGSGPKSFTVKLPFFLSRKGLFKELRDQADGVQVELTLGGKKAFIEKREVHLLLTVPGFKTEDAAREFLSRIGIGFVEFTATHQVGLQFDVTPKPLDDEFYRSVVLMAGQDAPKGWIVNQDERFIDGVSYPFKTYIIPEHQKIIEHPARLVEFSRVFELTELEKAFAAGAAYPAPAKVFANKKIRLAIEVFTNAFYHRDERVTLINLVTVLEILSDQKRPPKTVIALIDKMQQAALDEAATRKTKRGKQPYEIVADRLNDLRRISVSEAFRNLVYEYGETGLARAESDQIAKEIYDVRSKLVHEGEVRNRGGVAGEHRIVIALDRLQKLVPVILANKMRVAK